MTTFAIRSLRSMLIALLCLAPIHGQTSQAQDLLAPAIVATAVADVYTPAYDIPLGPRVYPEGVNPLTGLPYPDDAARNRRNLIIKVSNWPPQVRPQHGINAADLVYEYEAEGGVTRFAAIYRNNDPQQVGSIRSARLLDMELIRMYAALLAYSGASGPLHAMYIAAPYRHRLLSPSLGQDCERAGFCRDERYSHRGYEHTLFANAQKLYATATLRRVNQGYRALGFAFALEPDVSGAAARDIYMNWYNRTDTRWQYDAEHGVYLRYADGKPHGDAADNTQLWADNLLFLQVTHLPRPDLFAPGSPDESQDVRLLGWGSAIVLRDGMLYRGAWRRDSERDGEALQLVAGDGSHIPLKPGRSWITVMRNTDMLEINATPQAHDTIATADQG